MKDLKFSLKALLLGVLSSSVLLLLLVTSPQLKLQIFADTCQ